MAPSLASLAALDLRSSDAPQARLAAIRAVLVAVRKCQCNVHQALHLTNDLMEAHGVETISDPESGRDLAWYVNTGDTYAATVLYDVRRARFLVTSWGDWYERTPAYRRASR